MKVLIKRIKYRQLKKLWQQIWSLDLQYRQIAIKINTHLKKMNAFDLQNSNKSKRLSIYQYCKQSIVAIYPLLVCFTDLLLAFVVFRELSAQLDFINPIWSAFFISLILVGIELSLGALLENASQLRRVLDKEQKNEVGIMNRKMILLNILAICVIFVVPIISLSEFFAQRAALDAQVSLGYLSQEGRSQAFISLLLKYGGLSLLSLITHGFVVFSTKQIIHSYSVLIFRKNWKRLKKVEKQLLERKDQLQQLLIQKLVNYESKRLQFINRFGIEKGLENPSFSHEILQLYSGIKSNTHH